LALIFGTLLSSQGTDASFVLTLSGFPPGFRSSFLRFRLYQILSGLTPGRSGICFPGLRFRVSLSGESDSIRSFPPDFPASDSWMMSRVRTRRIRFRGYEGSCWMAAELVQFQATVRLYN
ncbi:hypothetical protein, partial [Streptomyces sp. NPDC059389]|uniref:hypothetical protein n=1 Tax=Streptomyces sp. NPDC059389 TaxID=3346818 RepID=UPI00368822B2